MTTQDFRSLPLPTFLDIRAWWTTMARFGARFARLDEQHLEHHRIVVRGDFMGLWWVWTHDNAKDRPGSFYLRTPDRRDLRLINDKEFAIRIGGTWTRFIKVDGPEVKSEPETTPEPEVKAPPTLTEADLVVGGRYNWKGQPERLVYMGTKTYPGNGTWHQFAKVDEPEVCWSEVVSADIPMFEATIPDPLP